MTAYRVSMSYGVTEHHHVEVELEQEREPTEQELVELVQSTFKAADHVEIYSWTAEPA